jgi:hypothetical protein
MTSDVHDITETDCDRAIEDLIERIVACHCNCPVLLLDLNRWKQRKLRLQLPGPS